MNQNQNTGAYTAADPNERFFFLIDALKKKMYNDQVIIPLMNEFLRRGMYREFLQVAAMRIELERQQNEEKRCREIEARNKRASRSFIYTVILTLVASSLLLVYLPYIFMTGTSAICGLAFAAVVFVGVACLIMMVFNALLRAGRY